MLLRMETLLNLKFDDNLMMKYYELTCLISPNFSEERLIAYLPTKPIKKQLTSTLITLEFYTEPEKIKEIEKKLKAESGIQRYIILNKEIPRPEVKISKRLPRETLIKTEKKSEEKPKVELKEIEKKLEEILGE